jgi:TraM recognition site of TraD and TraG
MDSLTLNLKTWTIAAMQWASPWWFVCTAAALVTISALNVLPLRVPPTKEHEYGFTDVVKIGLRQLSLTSLGFLFVVFWPAMYFATLSVVAPTAALGEVWFFDYAGRQAWAWGWMLPVSIAAGIGGRVAWGRNGVVWWSKLTQRWRVKQEDHKLSDIRVEVGKLQTRDFKPREHYKPDQMFLGLDTAGQPMYLPMKTFRETHMQVVGPTRFGKGVLLGVMLEQCIQSGQSVVYIDPKADKFAPYIMAAACEAAGRKFVYIDLNNEDTKWAPFEGGGERDRRSRIVNCFGLNNTGDGSDFYKSKERAILDTILPRAGSSIAGLRAALDARGDDGKTEFAALPSLNPKKGGGNKIGDALKAGAAVYVRGSLDDPTVKRATQVLISEVIQEARRLGTERNTHLTLAIDELKFMISQEISDALATIAGFNVNMILLHQSIKDLRAPEDRSLNVQALESGVLVNCQVKLMYRASDPETAEWASKLSGTKIVRTTKSQKVEHNRYGGEKYTTDRTVTDVEVPVITPNEMLSLSPRVGVFFVPERLASVLYTCFISADTERVLYKRPQPPAPGSATAPIESPQPSAPVQAGRSAGPAEPQRQKSNNGQQRPSGEARQHRHAGGPSHPEGDAHPPKSTGAAPPQPAQSQPTA